MSLKCPICTCKLELRATNIYSTQCGHIFHYNCIISWLNNGHNNCPTCRNQVRTLDIFQLFFSPNIDDEDSERDAQVAFQVLDNRICDMISSIGFISNTLTSFNTNFQQSDMQVILISPIALSFINLKLQSSQKTQIIVENHDSKTKLLQLANSLKDKCVVKNSKIKSLETENSDLKMKIKTLKMIIPLIFSIFALFWFFN